MCGYKWALCVMIARRCFGITQFKSRCLDLEFRRPSGGLKSKIQSCHWLQDSERNFCLRSIGSWAASSYLPSVVSSREFSCPSQHDEGFPARGLFHKRSWTGPGLQVRYPSLLLAVGFLISLFHESNCIPYIIPTSWQENTHFLFETLFLSKLKSNQVKLEKVSVLYFAPSYLWLLLSINSFNYFFLAMYLKTIWTYYVLHITYLVFCVAITTLLQNIVSNVSLWVHLNMSAMCPLYHCHRDVPPGASTSCSKMVLWVFALCPAVLASACSTVLKICLLSLDPCLLYAGFYFFSFTLLLVGRDLFRNFLEKWSGGK